MMCAVIHNTITHCTHCVDTIQSTTTPHSYSTTTPHCTAVRTSSAASDPNSEDLQCLLDYRSLLGMLKHILRVPETMPGGVRRAGERVLPNIKLAPFGGPGALPGALPGPGGMITPRDAATNPAEQKLLQARTGREAFLLTYKVEWPLSVVISEQSLTQYQLVFRHLFELKYVERELNTAWRIYQNTKSLPRYIWGV